MLALILTAALACAGSLVLGQGALALCGARAWSWLAAPVGLAVMILLAVPAIHVPGRAASTAAVMLALIAGGVVLLVRRRAHRPAVGDLLAGVPVALLVLVPFVVSARAGTLGVSVDDDMGAHLLLAEAYRSAAVARVSPLLPEYPLGPHALAATLAECVGARTDLAFAGMTAAVPVLLGWTALAALARVPSHVHSRAPWWGGALAATVVGMPFLIAGFYAEGSFKELFEALFVLGATLLLAGFAPALDGRRWVPLALLAAGAVSVYSAQGLVWPALLLGCYVAGRGAARAWSGGPRAVGRACEAQLMAAALALAVLLVVLIPQLARVERFISGSANNGIATTNLGNLLGPLPGWEAFGVWGNADFRLAPTAPFTAGMWTAFVGLLVLFGAAWSLRRGCWMLAVAAGSAMLVWAYAAHTQSPYVAAKALTIASPLLLLLAVLPLVRGGGRARRGDGRAPLGEGRLAPALLALVLLVGVVHASLGALRSARVGPSAHLLELRSLRPLLGSQPTLFLGVDDFVNWELAGARVTAAYLDGTPQVSLRAQKEFVGGEPLDFDSVEASTLDRYDWVITTRDAAASMAPSEMHLVRTTASYELWRRVGAVQRRATLEEGPEAGAILNCATAAGRAVLAGGGVAAVRAPSVEAPAPSVAPGASATVTLALARGEWELESPYRSPLPLAVSAPGLRVTLPANLDALGPRWPIGRIRLAHAGAVAVTFHVAVRWLAPSSLAATPGAVIATPLGTERVVALRKACGELVDWYRAA
jgi:hypothetical protein